MKTEHTQEYQESLTRDNRTLVHTVLRAHIPIYSLLNSVVYWCSQHWQRARTLVHRFNSPLCNALSVPQLQSSVTAIDTPYPLNATLWFTVTTSISCGPLILYAVYATSGNFVAVLVSPWYRRPESPISLLYWNVLAYREPWRQMLRESPHD